MSNFILLNIYQARQIPFEFVYDHYKQMCSQVRHLAKSSNVNLNILTKHILIFFIVVTIFVVVMNWGYALSLPYNLWLKKEEG